MAINFIFFWNFRNLVFLCTAKEKRTKDVRLVKKILKRFGGMEK